MVPTVSDFAAEKAIVSASGRTGTDPEIVTESLFGDVVATWFARNQYHVCVCRAMTSNDVLGIACSFEVDILDFAPIVVVLIQKVRSGESMRDVLCVVTSSAVRANLFANGLDSGQVVSNQLDPHLLILDSTVGPHLIELRESIAGGIVGSLVVPVE
jgi:hypothetical protein